MHLLVAYSLLLSTRLKVILNIVVLLQVSVFYTPSVPNYKLFWLFWIHSFSDVSRPRFKITGQGL